MDISSQECNMEKMMIKDSSMIKNLTNMSFLKGHLQNILMKELIRNHIK